MRGLNRMIVPPAATLAGLLALAGCATPPAADNGPLAPVGDISQIGADTSAPATVHDFNRAPPGIGGGVDDGPAAPGEMRGSGGL